ncbi:hypothetical protein Ahia01_001401900 [Argonauta hians]
MAAQSEPSSPEVEPTTPSPSEVEDFYGVYLLYNVNPTFRDRIYIGYTVDPNRRVRQHNAGRHAGGARKTSNRGPWEMVLIIHGFPNHISALRFEWAWQHPTASRRLRHVPAKKSGELDYNFRLRVLGEMLRASPWHRLPLTIRWLKQDYCREFPPRLRPPGHMPFAYGPVTAVTIAKNANITTTTTTTTAAATTIATTTDSTITTTTTTTTGNTAANNNNNNKKKNNNNNNTNNNTNNNPRLNSLSSCYCCCVCQLEVESPSSLVRCLKCGVGSHMVCLARHYLSPQTSSSGPILPVDGSCPVCNHYAVWGDIIRFKNGCYRGVATGGGGGTAAEGGPEEQREEEEEDEEDWTNALSQAL